MTTTLLVITELSIMRKRASKNEQTDYSTYEITLYHKLGKATSSTNLGFTLQLRLQDTASLSIIECFTQLTQSKTSLHLRKKNVPKNNRI